MPEERKVCRTPTPGKKPTSIPAWKYDVVRRAVLKALPKKQPGLPAKDLPARVAELLDAPSREKLGSITWHTTTVKLEMEAAGEIGRMPGIVPQHLVRL